ncbi:MAG: sensor histidine kinase KdpD [Deltaproteobacteria bacterium]|nr:sensor histidine kinase KdpD [Deltaproteobacteria bacterium]
MGTTSDETRPDPDLLLKRVNADAEKAGRARLKVWFGMAPGVGKTYAMLESARRLRDAGVDVVVGVVETHGRGDTAALAQGLEFLPPRTVDHRGTTLYDFDLDLAIQRKPKVLLVDELAHTNAPGGRHLKRWQDVLDLLDAGIEVHTTLNVQHVDSLNDIVREVTGVSVRETVPDHLLDRADEIELVDLAPDALLERLAAGKVYLGEQAARAAENFFRRGNLLTLRELALRKTADRVDADVQAWREAQASAPTAGARDKLLVCVGTRPGSAEVIRAARRLADRLRAPWIAVHVDASERAPLSDEARARVEGHMRLAESLGAETTFLAGQDAASTVVTFARRVHVTRILVGHRPRTRLSRITRHLRRTFVDTLLEVAGDLELHVVAEVLASKDGAAPDRTKELSPPRRSPPVDYAWAMLPVGVATAIGMLGRDALPQPDLVMLYLVGIMLIALRAGRGPALVASALSVVAYDICFVPPYYELAVSDWRHLLTFSTMFVVGFIISTLTSRLRMQDAASRAREARTAVLFGLSRDLAAADHARAIAATSVRHLSNIFECEASLFAGAQANATDAPLAMLATTTEAAFAPTDLAVVRWAFEHGRPAGIGADALPGAKVAAFPLGAEGVLVLRPRGTETEPPRGRSPAPLATTDLGRAESRHFAELCARQIAFALGRASMHDRARDASVRAETEEMRNALLSSVSHDLRTPLATITGSATTLRDAPTEVPAATRKELLDAICDEAMRLEHLVSNLLDMTRLDSGTVAPRREWVPTDELVGATLTRFERALGTRRIDIVIHPTARYLEVDPVLFGQLLGNLVENAEKYSPAGTPLRISFDRSLRGVEIAVADEGPGFTPGDELKVFERFYRGRDAASRGSGLGLAIARAIAHAHGGEMAAATRAGGGAIVSCLLPGELAAESPPDFLAARGDA